MNITLFRNVVRIYSIIVLVGAGHSIRNLGLFSDGVFLSFTQVFVRWQHLLAPHNNLGV